MQRRNGICFRTLRCQTAPGSFRYAGLMDRPPLRLQSHIRATLSCQNETRKSNRSASNDRSMSSIFRFRSSTGICCIASPSRPLLRPEHLAIRAAWPLLPA